MRKVSFFYYSFSLKEVKDFFHFLFLAVGSLKLSRDKIN